MIPVSLRRHEDVAASSDVSPSVVMIPVSLRRFFAQRLSTPAGAFSRHDSSELEAEGLGSLERGLQAYPSVVMIPVSLRRPGCGTVCGPGCIPFSRHDSSELEAGHPGTIFSKGCSSLQSS